jgi:hypothetical protein
MLQVWQPPEAGGLGLVFQVDPMLVHVRSASTAHLSLAKDQKLGAGRRLLADVTCQAVLLGVVPRQCVFQRGKRDQDDDAFWMAIALHDVDIPAAACHGPAVCFQGRAKRSR